MTNKEKIMKGLEVLERLDEKINVTISVNNHDDVSVSFFSEKTFYSIPITLDEFMKIDTLDLNKKALFHSLSIKVNELMEGGTSASDIKTFISALTS